MTVNGITLTPKHDALDNTGALVVKYNMQTRKNS